jgi:hypothetical protein
MTWLVQAYLDDGESRDVCTVDTLEEAQGRIESILLQGFDIEKENRYTRYPSKVVKRVDAIRKE